MAIPHACPLIFSDYIMNKERWFSNPLFIKLNPAKGSLKQVPYSLSVDDRQAGRLTKISRLSIQFPVDLLVLGIKKLVNFFFSHQISFSFLAAKKTHKKAESTNSFLLETKLHQGLFIIKSLHKRYVKFVKLHPTTVQRISEGMTYKAQIGFYRLKGNMIIVILERITTDVGCLVIKALKKKTGMIMIDHTSLKIISGF